ncbi:MAG: LON peptidase substrate-binding domain-containing protein [Hyphomonadaceae bacterium]|nr:LON peptidase substrate-binding domain-containing protein [Hyphomonadaceae bacterium]
MSAQTYRQTTDLPREIALFPLAGAVLFPRWTLPLNIFEPRYLNMIDDAMSGTRMIGMVQTMGGPKAYPELAQVGCAGRITSYSETEDGRYLIVLTGICRFGVNEIPDVATPYRVARPDWARFEQDLAAPSLAELPSREDLSVALKAYVARNEMTVDWAAIDEAPLETLIHALSASCPFDPMEKQALLETPDLCARAETLIALLELDIPGSDTGRLQ